MEYNVVGMDIAKNIFHIFTMAEDGKATKKKLKRKQVLEYFANHRKVLIGIEACASGQYWARELIKLGHEVKLINPRYVKPFVKGNKNDFNDAEGIYDAISRPNMRTVAVKTIEQQDIQAVHRLRQALVKQRTGLVNQVRAMLYENGMVLPKGINQARKRLPEVLEDAENGLSGLGRELIAECYERLLALDETLKGHERRIRQLHKNNETSQQVGAVRGIGPITATIAVSNLGDGKHFRNGREYAASLGLVPRQHSSGGKAVLLGISKRGDRYLRTLLIHGARTVLKTVDGKTDALSCWLKTLKQRRDFNVAAVALANKNARTIWAMVSRGEAYRFAET